MEEKRGKPADGTVRPADGFGNLQNPPTGSLMRDLPSSMSLSTIVVVGKASSRLNKASSNQVPPVTKTVIPPGFGDCEINPGVRKEKFQTQPKFASLSFPNIIRKNDNKQFDKLDRKSVV